MSKKKNTNKTNRTETDRAENTNNAPSASNATPTPAPAPAPTPPDKPKRERGQIDQAALDAIQMTEEIMNAALKDGRGPILTKKGYDLTKLATIATEITADRKLAGKAVLKTTDRKKATGTETERRKALLDLMKDARKAAKQKVEAGEANQILLEHYVLTSKISNNRTLLEQAANDFIANAEEDRLPGIEMDEIGALQTALADYQAVQTDQTNAQSDATGQRKLLDEAMDRLAGLRHELQLAAERAWKHTDPKNAGIRVEFKLPPDKAFTV